MAAAPPALSPLAPKAFPTLPAVAGVRTATAAAAIKYAGRDDVLLCAFPPGTAVAGVLTRSKCASAPVAWCRRLLSTGQAEALLVNAGNANAFTGKAGDAAVERSVEAVCDALDIRPSRVFTASTGVIGEPLPATHRIAAVMDDWLQADTGGFARRARHHDHRHLPQGRARDREIGGTTSRMVGVAKGSGMIAPDMATMLSFVFTDADPQPQSATDAERRGRAHVQLHHRRRRHLHQRHAARLRHRRHENRPAVGDADDPALADFAARWKTFCAIWRTRW
jgi:glutamate N-acetyltransferase/amino-acid N-acetyltransferase